MTRTFRIYLVGIFLIGALSAAAGVNWLRQGEIVFRSSDSSGESSDASSGENQDADVVARIDRGSLLFLPIAATWFQLGSGIAALTALSLAMRDRSIERWAGYACIALIFLGVATALAGYSVPKEPPNPANGDSTAATGEASNG